MSIYITNHLIELYSIIISLAFVILLVCFFKKVNQVISLKTDLINKTTLLDEKDTFLEDKNFTIDKSNKEIEELREYNTQYRATIARLETQLENSQTNETLIKNILNEVMEDGRQKLNEYSNNNLEGISKSWKENLKNLEKKIEDVNKDATEERIRLAEQVKYMYNLTKEVGNNADNLAKALKGEKIKQIGNWGEFQLEAILQFHNFKEGIHYYKEAKDFILYRDGHLTKERPDIIINLPNNNHIIIDAKTTIASYQLYYDAPLEHKEEYLDNFKNDIRKHINDLSKKAYHNLDNINTPQFTLMFIPIEAAFLLIIQDNKIFEEAWKKNILITSPTTLSAVLLTYSYIIKNDQKIQNIQEIMSTAEELYNMLATFCTELEKVGTAIDNAKSAYTEALLRFQGKGKGATITYQANKLKKLGLSPKKDHKYLQPTTLPFDNLIED